MHATAAGPLLFVIDGAKSHIDLAALNYAVLNSIHLVCLSAHMSHILQPADICLFGPFKHYWKQLCAAVKVE